MRRAPYRVAHVMPWPTVAGTEIATLRMIQALDGAQFTHVAFCANYPSHTSDVFGAAGVKTAGYNIPYLSFRAPYRFLMASVRLARDLRTVEADLLHCSDVIAGVNVTLAGRLAKLPVICHVRNPYPAIPVRDRALLRMVTHFVFVSRHSRDHFAYAVPDHRASVIYDGLDLPQFSHDNTSRAVREEFQIPEHRKLVGMAARFAFQKDYLTLVRAARRLVAEDPEIHFLLVGDHSSTADSREHYDEICQEIARNHLGPHFSFAGFRPDVPRLLAAMDVVVLATHFEGFGLVLLEAMAQGRPVVGTAVGGIPEFVREGETGLLHRHEDDTHLALQLRSLLRDGALAARIGEAGRQLVRTQFCQAKFAKRIAALYNVLLRK